MSKDTKAALLATLLTLLAVMGGLKAAPPPAGTVGVVGEQVIKGAIELVQATPTNERYPNPPVYTCSFADACKPRIAVWRQPQVVEYCNGASWVDSQVFCPDAG